MSGPASPTEAAHTLADEAASAVPPAREPGETIGRYVVTRRLGSGGMGIVYAARDPELDREVAIKVLRTSAATRRGSGIKRLLREAQAMARLAHENIVTVHDVGAKEDEVYIAMELVDGLTVDLWIERHSPRWNSTVDTFVRAAQGLVAAHEAGIVHRDIKPENVMVSGHLEGRPHRVLLMDFGLAREVELPSEPDQERTTEAMRLDGGATGSGAHDPDTLTATGAVMGTPAYMAPEQHLGAATDERTDQFSFCVALYEALYGERPYRGETVAALMFQASQGLVAAPPRRTRVPAAVRDIVVRGLAPTPSDRWPTMHALCAALRLATRPRRRLPVALLGGAGAAVAITAFALSGEGGPCQSAEDHLEGVWDAPRRAAVRANLSERGEAGVVAWGRVERLLDAYAESWVATHSEVCRDRSEADEVALDRRMACLRGRLTQLEALVEIVSTADDEASFRSVSAAAALPPLSTCLDDEALEQAIPPPADPSLVPVVAELRDDLSRARAMYAAGLFSEGVRIANRVAAEAESIDYDPVLAEANMWRGKLLIYQGKAKEAAQALELAYWTGKEAGHDKVAAEAASLLIYVNGYQLHNREAADAWRRHAEAEVERADPDGLIAGQLKVNIAVVIEKSGELDEAETLYRDALDFYAARGDAEHPRAAAAHHNLAILLLRARRLSEAADEELRSIAIREVVLGEMHPDLTGSRMTLGNILRATGDFEGASDEYDRAYEIALTTLGPDHPRVAAALGSQGIVMSMRGEHDAAIDRFERVVEMNTRVKGADHPDTASAIDNLGNALNSSGRFEEAATHHSRALRLREVALGGDHPEVATSAANLGRVLLDLGKPDDALEYFERAAEIRRKSLGPKHPRYASDLLVIGDALMVKGDLAGAREYVERSLEIYESAEGSPLYRGEARFTYAQILLQAGEREQALSMLGLAEEDLRASGPPGQPRLELCAQWRAREGLEPSSKG